MLINGEEIAISRAGPILLVDDDPSLLDSYFGILTERGYDVVTACDGLDAIERYIERVEGGVDPFAAIVSDVQMPKLDGLDFYYSLRCLDDCLNPGIPVVLMSACADYAAGDLDNPTENRFFLPKPLERDRFHDTVATALERGVAYLNR